MRGRAPRVRRGRFGGGPVARTLSALRRGLPVALGLSEPAALSAELPITAATARRLGVGARRLALAVGRLDAPGVATLRLRPARRLRTSLGRARTLRARLVVTAPDAAGNRRRVERTVRFRR